MVVNVSSDAAVTPYPQWGAYGASKAALHHLSRIWNEELAAEGVTVLSLDPGDMDTPLHAAAVPDADRSPAEAAGRPRRASWPTRSAAVLARDAGRSPATDGGDPMIAATAAGPAPGRREAAGRRRPGRLQHRPRSAFADAAAGRRSGGRERRRDAAGQPGRTASADRPPDRGPSRRAATSLALDRVTGFTAVLFGLGDFRMRTEDRPSPPAVQPGDRLVLGPLRATVDAGCSIIRGW